MDKKRFPVLILGATLVVAVTLVALGFNAAPEAKGSSAPNTGFGDLHRFESRLASSERSILASSQANAGMGDLHRYEVRPILLASAAQENSASNAGMGDLHRYEATQGIQQ